MRKKQKNSLKEKSYLLICISSIFIILCASYYLYEKYSEFTESKDNLKLKKSSICYGNDVCFLVKYKLVDTNIYYELLVYPGTKDIKEKFLDYYTDVFKNNKHHILLKDYYKTDKKITDDDMFKQELSTKAYDKVLNQFNDALIVLTVNDIDGFVINKIYIKNNKYEYTKMKKDDGRVFHLSYSGKIELSEQEAKIFNNIWFIFYDDVIEAFDKLF